MGDEQLLRAVLARGAQVSEGGGKSRRSSPSDPSRLASCAEVIVTVIMTLMRMVMKPQVDARDAHGHTALLWAASQGHEGVLKVLLAYEADPNAANLHRLTPLISAADAGHLRVCEILLQQGAAINAQTSAGSTALMGAALNGHGPVVQLLLARGADVTTRNREGATAQQLAQDADVKALFTLTGLDSAVMRVR
jgi:uncharacterized protein